MNKINSTNFSKNRYNLFVIQKQTWAYGKNSINALSIGFSVNKPHSTQTKSTHPVQQFKVQKSNQPYRRD